MMIRPHFLRPLSRRRPAPSAIGLATAAAVCLLAVAGGAAAGSDAADKTDHLWRHRTYPYHVVDQSLADVLRAFGRHTGIGAEVSARLQGRVRDFRHDGSSEDFLRRLGAEHHVDWVFDGHRLFFSDKGETISRIWPANAAAEDKASTALAKAGIDDPRFPLRYDAARGGLSLMAPPRYVQMAAPIIDRLLTPAPKAVRAVNVIHGRPREG